MVADDRDSRSQRETPEDAARAIASALEFLRDEALAAGMHDVHVVIELARVTASGHCRQTTRTALPRQGTGSSENAG